MIRKNALVNSLVTANIENLIYEIRGVQVMLDFDLARLYNCKNGTKEINQAVKRKLPYVFTEQGVAMLASVLRSYTAMKESVLIMRAYVAMRHYIGSNVLRLSNVETKVIEHDNLLKLVE